MMVGKNNYSSQTWDDFTPISEGETTFFLRLPRGAHVRSAQLEIAGTPFEFRENLFAPKYGATVTPIEPDKNKMCKGLVVDFHALRAVNRLLVVADQIPCCRLQAWAGITWYQPQPMDSYVLKIPSIKETEVGFPELEIQKMMLTFHEEPTGDLIPPMIPAKLTGMELFCRSTPANLSLRVGDGSPSWTHAGALSKKLVTSDLAERLNRFIANDVLEDAQEEHLIPLTLRSGTLGQVHISLVNLDYYFVIDRFSEGDEEKTLNFSCNQSWRQAVEFDKELPEEAEIQKAIVFLSGSFSDERFFRKHALTEQDDETHAVMVSKDQWAAQEIVFEEGLNIAGIDLYMMCLSENSNFSLEIQSGVKQSPSGVSHETVEYTVEGEVGSAQWYCLSFPSPLELVPSRSYWLVLKGNAGLGSWQVYPGESAYKNENWNAVQINGLSYSKDHGASWVKYNSDPWRLEALHGKVRFRHLPSKFRLPITMQVGETDVNLNHLADLGEDLCKINFKDQMRATGKETLQIVASNQGHLNFSGLRVEYFLPESKKENEHPEEKLPSVLADEDIQIIDGIGSTYAEILRGVGIETIRQLAELDVFSEHIDIPVVKLLEIQSKATLVHGVHIDLSNFPSLLSVTISDLLLTPIGQLMEQSQQQKTDIKQMVKELRILQVALDNTFLEEITLGKLLW